MWRKKTSLSDESKAKQTKKLKGVISSSKTPGQNESAHLSGEPPLVMSSTSS